MKIEDFIDKHGLDLCPVFLSDHTAKMRYPDGLTKTAAKSLLPSKREHWFEVYANADKTLWVSLNRTERTFRILFCEIVPMASDWENADLDYEAN